jgi:hypothetical protein
MLIAGNIHCTLHLPKQHSQALSLLFSPLSNKNQSPTQNFSLSSFGFVVFTFPVSLFYLSLYHLPCFSLSFPFASASKVSSIYFFFSVGCYLIC